jgi:hypothetical protein
VEEEEEEEEEEVEVGYSLLIPNFTLEEGG